jgi:uncharacterized protein YgbK (DUF1537 family)
MSATLNGVPERLEALLGRDSRRIIVLDDDPTGTQAVSDVDVVLVPSRARFDSFFGSAARALYVLTNTRAMPRATAIAYLEWVVAQIDAAAVEAGQRWVPILRGDSTLRGHVFAEADVLGGRDAVVLFVPAFPEGGRTTVDGAQLVEIDGRRLNAADTEFAADPTFGYRSRDLVSWTAEVGDGRPAAMIQLGDIRARGADAVVDALERATVGSVVIPEAETADDLRSVAIGLIEAESLGIRVVVRSASSFAAIRAGLVGRRIDVVPQPRDWRILVACGSYTAASTTQLAVLGGRGLPILEVASDQPVEATIDLAREHLRADGIAIVATPRVRSDDGSLTSGATMMERLTDVVGQLRDVVDAVICKGGITSAAAAISLGAEVARVEGQVGTGIALWSLSLGDGRSMPYVVMPGNVGGPNAIADVLDRVR